MNQLSFNDFLVVTLAIWTLTFIFVSYHLVTTLTLLKRVLEPFYEAGQKVQEVQEALENNLLWLAIKKFTLRRRTS